MKTHKTNLHGGKKLIRLLAGFTLLLSLAPTNILAATDQEKLNNLNQEIQAAKTRESQAQNKQRSLKEQIAGFDAEIRKVEAAIKKTEDEISKLTNQISKTESEIALAKKDLADKKSKLKEILRTSYENQQVTIFELIWGSDSFSDFISKKEYMDEMQLEIKGLAEKITALTKELEIKKKTIITEKKKAEELKTVQAGQQKKLTEQRGAKNHLLAVTKGDEAQYKALATKLRAQYDNLQAEIWRKAAEEARRRAAAAAAAKRTAPSAPAPRPTYSAPRYVYSGYVRRGDIIGYQGNSGFSSGTHLHFEIRDGYQNHLNPGNYIGNGYFGHPLPGSYMTQGYGYTTWWAYAFHTGWDLSAGYGAPIRATADGEIVTRVSGRGNTYPYSLDYGNYVIIRHTNGMYSLYGHLA